MELPLLIGTGAAVFAVLLVAILVFLKGRAKEQPKEGEDEHEQVSPMTKGAPQAEKKKERKFDRSRKISHSSHPLLAAELKGHTRNIVDMDFDINGKYVITASEDRSIRLWTAKDLLEKEHKYFRTNLDFDSPTKVKFSPDGKAFITAMDMHNTICVYKLKKEAGKVTAEKALDFEQLHQNPIIALDMSSNGRFIMSCCEQMFVVWGLRGEKFQSVLTHMSPNTCAMVSPCGKFVACTGFTPDVKIWEVTFAQDAHFKQVNHVMDLKGHNAGVQGVTFSGDGKSAASVSRDGTWKMWSIDVDYRRGEMTRKLFSINLPSKCEAPKISMSPDGRVVVLGLDHSIYVYSCEDGELMETMEHVYQSSVSCLLWHPDSSLLLSVAAGERHVQVWHNSAGLRRMIAQLEERRPQAKGNEVYQKRLEEEIAEAKTKLEQLEH